MSIELALSILLFFGGLSAKFSRIDQVCQPLSPKFTFYGSTNPVDFHLEDAYNKGIMVGKGGFGEVHKSLFGHANIPEVAIKHIRNQNDVLDEFDVLTKFSPMNVGPKFFGCQYNSGSIFIAQTLLYKDLNDRSTVLRLKKLPNSQFLERIKEVIESLKIMWDNNYVHMDIKEHNIMTNKDLSKFYLIDFGLAQSKNDYMAMAGTPLYMPPSKWERRLTKPLPKDDLYSLALAIGVLEAFGKRELLTQYDMPNGYRLMIGQSCFTSQLTSSCQQLIKRKVIGFLQKANFGEYHRSSRLRLPSTINFTTLVAMMINYFDYPFDFAQTVSILDRLIKEFKALEAAGVTVTKPKTSDFVDPEDRPDTYDAKRIHPRVHPLDQSNFEYQWKLFVEPQLQKEELDDKAWKLKIEQMEQQRLLKEAEENNRKREAELLAKRAEEERKAKALKEKERREALEAELRQKKILAEADAQRRKKQLELEQQERDRKINELKEQERKKQLAQKKLMEEEALLAKKRKEAEEEKQRLDKINEELHTTMKNIDILDKKYTPLQNFMMGEANPVLVQRNALQAGQIKEMNKLTVFSPRQSGSNGVQPVENNVVRVNFIKQTNMNQYIPKNLPPNIGEAFQALNFGKLPNDQNDSGAQKTGEGQEQKKEIVNVDIQKRFIRRKVVDEPKAPEIDMKRHIQRKPAVREISDSEFKRILPQKPNKFIYRYSDGTKQAFVMNAAGKYVKEGDQGLDLV